MQLAKVKKTSLLSPFNSSDTTFTLREFVDHKGNALTLADFESLFVISIRQGDITELVLCDGITQNADGSATIEVATDGRDLDGTYPYAGGASGQDFSSSAEVVNGDDPYTLYQITKAYADALAIAGVPNGSTTVKGIFELATDAETVAGTETGATGAPLIVPNNSKYIGRLVKKRVTTEVSSATPTINTDNCDVHQITALAENITSMSTNLSGTPFLWDTLVVDFTSTGDYTIAWGANFENGEFLNLPTNLTTDQKLKCIFHFDGTLWRLMGFA